MTMTPAEEVEVLGPSQLELKRFLSTQSKLCSMCLFVPCICCGAAAPPPPPIEAVRVPSPVVLSDTEDEPPQFVSLSSLDNTTALVASEITSILKAHQISGIGFLQQTIKEDTGAILADYMGLGKTLQVLATVYTFVLTAAPAEAAGPPPAVLVLCPTICIDNWENEFVKWFPQKSTCPMYTLTASRSEAASHSKLAERKQHLQRWKLTGGILVMGYEMYRLLLSTVARRTTFSPLLIHPGPDLIVLDEGHRIKDRVSVLGTLLRQIRTRKRIVLTGYPVQNCLAEYWSMIDFARPQFLGTYDVFRDTIETPILNATSNEQAQELTERLTLKLKPMVLRRSSDVLKDQLPPKHEWVLYCSLSKLQRELYLQFLQHRAATQHLAGNDFLAAYAMLLRVVNHPEILLTSCTVTEEVDEWQATYTPTAGVAAEPPNVDRVEWAQEILSAADVARVENSSKMMLLQQIVTSSLAVQDKVLVFSQSIGTLDSIGKMLAVLFETAPEPTRGRSHQRRDPAKVRQLPKRARVVQEKENVDRYLRIDGSTSTSKRTASIREFNDPHSRAQVMLLSTRAGAEGINLHAANRVVLFDVSWNPSHDHQSMCRSHRFGQTKPVHIYRLVSLNTMESRVLALQKRKVGLADRVVDAIGSSVPSPDDVDSFFSIPVDVRELPLSPSITQYEDSVLNMLQANCPSALVQIST